MYVHDLRLPGHGVRPRGQAALRHLAAYFRRRSARSAQCPASSASCAMGVSSASSRSAKNKRSRRARRWHRWRAGRCRPHLPDQARLHEQMKGLRGIDTQTVNEKTGAAGRSGEDAHGDLQQALSGARLDRAVLRGRGTGRQCVDGVVAHARALPSARRSREGHRRAAGTRARDPCAGRGMLRPQRRRRRGARCAAARIATQGRIVKLQWMRDDEFGWEPLGSAMEMSVRAGLDAAGAIVDWQYDVWTCPHNMRPGNATRHKSSRRGPSGDAVSRGETGRSGVPGAAATATRCPATNSPIRRSSIISSPRCRSGPRR